MKVHPVTRMPAELVAEGNGWLAFVVHNGRARGKARWTWWVQAGEWPANVHLAPIAKGRAWTGWGARRKARRMWRRA